MNARLWTISTTLVAVLLVGVLCVSCGGKAAEAPGAGPLMSLLAGVPEDPVRQSDDLVYFVDYSAMESAYEATRPADAQEFFDLPLDVAHNVWWALFRNSAWSFSDHCWTLLETMSATVGFSALDVDRAIQFGAPPGTGLILVGSFDAEAVGAAYQANLDMAQKDIGGTPVWLWGDDPADGFMTDLSSVVNENPFGGYLGRRQPMIVSDDLLMSSADLDLVTGHADALAGEAPSLADAPGYRAAVDAIAQDADILQAIIAGPTMALSIAHQPAGVGLPSPEGAGTSAGAPAEDGTELPPFGLLIAADVVTADEQIARLGLVYPDATTAEGAGAILLERLSTYQSVAGRPFKELVTPTNGTGTRYYVRKGSDQAVLVLEFPAPRATPEQIAEMRDMGYDGPATMPGLIYRRVLEMLTRRDIGWLSTTAS